MREATALFFLVFTAKAQLKDCFTWDQQLSRDYPCDPEAAVSSCCGGQWICSSSLYCKGRTGEKFIGSCTDRSFQDAACPWPLSSQPNSGNMNILFPFDYKLNTTICSDGKVCPKNNFSASDNTTCCDNHQGKIEINFHNDAVLPEYSSDLSNYYALVGKTIPTDGVYVTVSSTPTLVTATRSEITALATSVITPKPTIPTASTEPPSTALASLTSSPSSSNLSAGVKAGIAIGVILGVLVIVASAGFILIWNRRRERSEAQEHPTNYTSLPPQEPLNAMYSKGELSGEPSKIEMDGTPSHPCLKTHEMAG